MKCNFNIFLLINIVLVIMMIFVINVESISISCIVIRINNPTSKQVFRYLKWRKYFPVSFNFYLLSMKKMNRSLLTRINMINVVVSFSEIKLVYPNITKLKGNCSNFKNSKLLSWISHSESIILFYKKLKLKYDYIWIIEQDVGFLGNLYDFVKLYEYNKKDLITIGVGKSTDRWVWYNCATDKYISRRLKYFNSNYGYVNRENIQRWSKLYIAKMMIDLQRDYHSQTETSTIELVFYHNLSYEIIPMKFIGYMSAGKSLTESKWINISNNKRNYNKFFHPLKF